MTHASEAGGSTRVDPDEPEGLIPDHIATQSELNVWEQENILQAMAWVQSTSSPALSEDTIRELHRRMFNRTWTWAGTYRRSDKNIGIPWPQIGVTIRDMTGNGHYWLEHAVYSIDEVAVRLHHRLVQIHPFPNGNGRHARLWTDMLLRENARPPLRWASSDLRQAESADRTAYIDVLRKADSGDLDPLLALLLTGRT